GVGVLPAPRAGGGEGGGEGAAAGAGAAGPPGEAPAVFLEHVAEQAELAEVLDFPGVVVQPLSALRDADAMVVGVAAKEEQRALADVVGQSEAQHILDELLRPAWRPGLEHGVAQPPRPHPAPGRPR